MIICPLHSLPRYFIHCSHPTSFGPAQPPLNSSARRTWWPHQWATPWHAIGATGPDTFQVENGAAMEWGIHGGVMGEWVGKDMKSVINKYYTVII